MPGKIVYADDQFVNQQSVKRHFEDMRIAEMLITFNDGQGVVDYFEEILNDITGENIVARAMPL